METHRARNALLYAPALLIAAEKGLTKREIYASCIV